MKLVRSEIRGHTLNFERRNALSQLVILGLKLKKGQLI